MVKILKKKIKKIILLKSKLKKLLSLLIRIYKGGEVGEIILGFEPADNTDMKILGISQNQMEIFNENIFESPLVSAIYSAARDMSVWLFAQLCRVMSPGDVKKQP